MSPCCPSFVIHFVLSRVLCLHIYVNLHISFAIESGNLRQKMKTFMKSAKDNFLKPGTPTQHKVAQEFRNSFFLCAAWSVFSSYFSTFSLSLLVIVYVFSNSPQTTYCLINLQWQSRGWCAHVLQQPSCQQMFPLDALTAPVYWTVYTCKLLTWTPVPGKSCAGGQATKTTHLAKCLSSYSARVYFHCCLITNCNVAI